MAFPYFHTGGKESTVIPLPPIERSLQFLTLLDCSWLALTMTMLGFCLLPYYISPSFTTTGQNLLGVLLRFSRRHFTGILQEACKELLPHEPQRETLSSKAHRYACAKEQGRLILVKQSHDRCAGVLGCNSHPPPKKKIP